MANDEATQAKPPYVSYRTFQNLLDRLEEGGIPQHIDRTYWGDFLAGGYGAQVMVAMRWLGLVRGEHNESQPLLTSLVPKSERRRVLAELLRERYEPIFEAVSLETGTAGRLQQAFKEQYGLDGDTLRKSLGFFVQAAQAAGLVVSPHITKKVKSRNGTSTRAPRPAGAKTAGRGGSSSNGVAEHSTDERKRPGDGGQTGNIRTIKLESGGSVTLNVSVDLIGLSQRDRDYVLRLIDVLKEYDTPRRDETPVAATSANFTGDDRSRPEELVGRGGP